MGGKWNMRNARWQFECSHTAAALAAHDGDVRATADALGISPSGVQVRAPADGKPAPEPPWVPGGNRNPKYARPQGGGKKRPMGLAAPCVCSGIDHDQGCPLG